MLKDGIPTRTRVLTAAGRLFAERGLDAATTREIAREAGVNEVTLFRLFQNKEGLRSAVLEHVLERQAELIAAQPKGASRGLRADIQRCAETYVAALSQNLSPSARSSARSTAPAKPRADCCTPSSNRSKPSSPTRWRLPTAPANSARTSTPSSRRRCSPR